MRSRARVFVPLVLSLVAAGWLGLADPAAAAAPGRDSTPGTYTVGLTRVSNTHPVVVTWGDGTTSRATSRCTPAKAQRAPKACSVRLSHVYQAKGTYKITMRFGRQVVGRQRAVVPFLARGWHRPAGWTQPPGWVVFPDGATFAPCSTVRWFYDDTDQPSTSAGMKGDVAAGLALLAERTGLRFVQTPDRAAATLRFGWADLTASFGPQVGGVGGRDRDSAYVRFSTTNWWPGDQWPGFGVVTQPDGSSGVGRGWLVVHETMHALGFDHVPDPAQVMNPTITVHDFGPGDLDGLRTAYLERPCG